MALLRNLLSRRFHSLLNLNPQNPLWTSSYSYILHPNTPHSLKIPPFPHRLFTSSPQIEDPVDSEPDTKQNNKKRPLHALFVEAVGLSEKTRIIETETETEEGETENKELKKTLRELEGEVRSFKEKAKKSVPKGRSLHDVFTNQPAAAADSVTTRKDVKRRKPVVMKELSPDMEIFVHHLYKKGYFKDANFAKDKNFDLSWFESFYARGYIKFAAQKFAADNQEIAKWLSGSALKQVAMFGCPLVLRSHVFPAKRLRKFFEIPENTVCSKCMLQQSCKFVNQSVWKGDTNNLDMAVVMKIITSYALESVDPQLVVPDEVNKSVSQLMKEVVKLSQTT